MKFIGTLDGAEIYEDWSDFIHVGEYEPFSMERWHKLLAQWRELNLHPPCRVALTPSQLRDLKIELCESLYLG